MLTFQNHGGYEMNDASYDTVHVGRDYGELNEEINEYLTSVAMSGDAFAELTEYFASVDRPVIVCMLGDHAPSFIDEIESTIPRSDDEKAIAERSVPYVVWSNYGADLSACPEITDVFGLMPELIHAAGLPLTSYYRTILDLKESFPVLASNGLYLTSDGEIGTYDAADPACDAIKRYYTMAYNAMIAGDDYSEDFYLPAS
jgi:phosphoglycerol transferase MdoB-like AlkP superfamily enzyme